MILPERVFGRSSAQMTRLGPARTLPIRSATVPRMPSIVRLVALERALERHEGDDRLSRVLVVLSDHGCLRHVGVGDDRGLHLGGREPVGRRR